MVMTKNRAILFLASFLILTWTVFSGCGGTTVDQNPDENVPADEDEPENDDTGDEDADEDLIEISEGMAIVGTFDGAAIEIAEEDVTVEVKVDDNNENDIFDDEELMGVFVFSSDDYVADGGQYVFLGVTLAQVTDLPEPETLTAILYGYSRVPDLDDRVHVAESGNFYLTEFSVEEGDTVSGRFELVLEEGEGEFTAAFSGGLIFEDL